MVPLYQLPPQLAAQARSPASDPLNPLFRDVGDNYLKEGASALTPMWRTVLSGRHRRLNAGRKKARRASARLMVR